MGRRTYHRTTSRLPRRMRPWGILVVAIVIAVWRLLETQWPATTETLPEGMYAIERAVDGDTLLLDDGRRLRLIGVDTPETVKPDTPVEPFGPEAARLTREFIDEAGGNVRIQFDREKEDKHGRLLGYVYHGQRMLNEELLRAGLAEAELGYPFSPTMKSRFRGAQSEAQRARRGIWAQQPSPPRGIPAR
jgi:micrococcal nuclease